MPKKILSAPGSAAEALDADMHETEVLDYKLKLPVKTLVKRIAGMANAHGGLIILGVAEIGGTGKPVKPVAGLADPDATEREIARQIRADLDPNPAEMRRVEYHGKTLVEIHIAKQRCLRWETDVPCFDVRVGSGTESMKRHEIEEAYLDRARKGGATAIISPVSIAVAAGNSTINFKIIVNNGTGVKIDVTALSLRIDAGTIHSAILPIRLYRDIPGGYQNTPGKPIPFKVPSGKEVTRNITGQSHTIPAGVDHVALSGSLKIGSKKVKLPQVFAHLLNPRPQSWGAINYNLAEFDSPSVGA